MFFLNILNTFAINFNIIDYYIVFILTVLTSFVKGEWNRIILLSFVTAESSLKTGRIILSINHPFCGGEIQ